MLVTVKQMVTVGTETEINIPDEIAANGAEAVMDYIQENFDKIPGGELETDNAFDWQLDDEGTYRNIDEALAELDENIEKD